MHKYINADADKSGESNAAYRSILTARLEMEADVDFARSFAPGKPVWMTEWGVSAGSMCRAGAALAMADCYLFLLENQDVYERANWFSVNGTTNSFLIFKEKRQLQYPLQKTSFASTYEIIRSVFENGQLLDGEMVTDQLKTDRGSIDAISARAVNKNGKTIILAVNLTDRPCRFVLKIEGTPFEKALVHEAMAFSNLSEVVVRDIDERPLTPIEKTDGGIMLPPLSVSRISGLIPMP
ncbi:hypothetical protein N9B73_08430 [Verrucomicrobiales bacterium]|nr:hypothetical protein [Verrucomicrobiales bacterium]